MLSQIAHAPAAAVRSNHDRYQFLLSAGLLLPLPVAAADPDP
jgi:hypothetical protein